MTESISLEEVQNSYVMDDLDEAVLVESLFSSTNESSAATDDDYTNYLIDNGIDLSQTEIEL
jgi:hypothetical protein